MISDEDFRHPPPVVGDGERGSRQRDRREEVRSGRHAGLWASKARTQARGWAAWVPACPRPPATPQAAPADDCLHAVQYMHQRRRRGSRHGPQYPMLFCRCLRLRGRGSGLIQLAEGRRRRAGGDAVISVKNRHLPARVIQNLKLPIKMKSSGTMSFVRPNFWYSVARAGNCRFLVPYIERPDVMTAGPRT